MPERRRPLSGSVLPPGHHHTAVSRAQARAPRRRDARSRRARDLAPARRQCGRTPDVTPAESARAFGAVRDTRPREQARAARPAATRRAVPSGARPGPARRQCGRDPEITRPPPVSYAAPFRHFPAVRLGGAPFRRFGAGVRPRRGKPGASTSGFAGLRRGIVARSSGVPVSSPSSPGPPSRARCPRRSGRPRPRSARSRSRRATRTRHRAPRRACPRTRATSRARCRDSPKVTCLSHVVPRPGHGGAVPARTRLLTDLGTRLTVTTAPIGVNATSRPTGHSEVA